VTERRTNANDADVSGESQHELAAGVLKQAAQDLRRFHGETGKVGREVYLDAYRWLTVDECSWPFLFLNVCQLLNLSPERVRQELICDFSLGEFSSRVRGCRRADNRVRASFRQLFMSERNDSASMPADYAETRNIVFHNAASVGESCCDEKSSPSLAVPN
jgi:hypothetical protein